MLTRAIRFSAIDVNPVCLYTAQGIFSPLQSIEKNTCPPFPIFGVSENFPITIPEVYGFIVVLSKICFR